VNQVMKPLLAAAIPLLAAAGSWITTGELNTPEVAVAITGFITAILVYFFRNRPTGFLASLKFIVAAVTPIVSALLQWAVTGSFQRAELATIIVGVGTSLLIYFTQNAPDVGGSATAGPATARVR
jgi:hypothetical protein